MSYTDNEKAIIWIDCFVGLSKEQKLKIINCTKDPSAILRDVNRLKPYVGKEIDEKTFNLLNAALKLNIDKSIIAELDKCGVKAVTCMSDDYPTKLLSIPNPPLILYCKGNISLLNSAKMFSMVGSRRTLPSIVAKAEIFSAELSKNGVTVVTGIAEGVEAAVINGALNSGNIISVLPGGFKHVYPTFHRSLFERIAEKGLVVSEHSPDVVSKNYFYPDRNRLLAALSDGVLVCSAGLKSGTSYTVDFANSYGKDVFAFPYTLGEPTGEGCNALIKEFAMLCDSVDDIFTALRVVKRKACEDCKLSEKEQKVYNCIKDGEIHIDILLQKTGMKIFEISPILTMLEIKKLIIKAPGNLYAAIK